MGSSRHLQAPGHAGRLSRPHTPAHAPARGCASRSPCTPRVAAIGPRTQGQDTCLPPPGSARPRHCPAPEAALCSAGRHLHRRLSATPLGSWRRPRPGRPVRPLPSGVSGAVSVCPRVQTLRLLCQLWYRLPPHVAAPLPPCPSAHSWGARLGPRGRPLPRTCLCPPAVLRAGGAAGSARASELPGGDLLSGSRRALARPRLPTAVEHGRPSGLPPAPSPGLAAPHGLRSASAPAASRTDGCLPAPRLRLLGPPPPPPPALTLGFPPTSSHCLDTRPLAPPPGVSLGCALGTPVGAFPRVSQLGGRVPRGHRGATHSPGAVPCPA